MSLNILVVIEKNSWMNAHIADSLAAMGNKVTRFFYGQYVGDFYGRSRRDEREQKNRALLNTAKTLKDDTGLDLIFCYMYDDFLLQKYARALSDLKIPMVNYNVDMPTQWFRQIRTARYFDIMLCGQRDNIEHLARYAKKIMYFPMAAKPLSVHNIQNPLETTYEVTFLGMAFPYRRNMLSKLAKASIPLTIFGKYWDSEQSNIYIHNIQETLFYLLRYAWPRFRAEGLACLWNALLNRFFINHKKIKNIFIPPEILKGPAREESLPAIFHNSKINIGFTRYANDNPNLPGYCQMKLRDFEVPMAGGFYLVEQSPGYDEAFIDGVEVVMWKTFPELLEKIRYYLHHDDKRISIAKKGKERAMRDHTWEVRFNTLFSLLGFSAGKDNVRFSN